MTVAPDMLQQFGGAPVGSDHRFEGWWGATTFFVDYDHGTAGARGDSMDAPTKHIRVAIANASAGDTIYVRPRDFSSGTYGEDPRKITPDTAANWTTVGKPNLSIIGTGKGMGHAGVHKCWVGGYSGVTTAVFNLYSPGCVIENFRMQPHTGATSGLIYSINNATANYNGGNETIINNDFHDGTSTCPALKFNATWQMEIAYNRFLNCDIGMYWDATYSNPAIIQIHDNKFLITASEGKCDCQTAGVVNRFFAYRNYHAGAQYTGGSPNKYFSFASASTGSIQNSYFGVADTTDTASFSLNNITQSGNYSSVGLII
jgi:hypothetical protein